MSTQTTGTALDVFRYADREVRVIQRGGEPWFVAADVCAVLGISNPSSSIGRLDEDERGLHTVETPSGLQSVGCINEPGLYSLILRSRKAEAKTFKRWVTHDVLPAIRKTGAYSAAPTALPVPQSFAAALQLAADQARLIEQQTRALVVAETARADLEPRAGAWDDLVSAEGDYLVGDAAKMLSRIDGIDTGQNRLYKYMASQGWVYRSTGKRAGHGPWRIYQTSVERGWLTEKISTGTHVSDGVEVANPPQVRVTVKGLERLRSMMLAGTKAQLRVV